MSEYITEWVARPLDDEFVREQIVRCRDCKYYVRYWQSDYCDYFSHVANNPDGFCAWGERRGYERA